MTGMKITPGIEMAKKAGMFIIKNEDKTAGTRILKALQDAQEEVESPITTVLSLQNPPRYFALTGNATEALADEGFKAYIKGVNKEATIAAYAQNATPVDSVAAVKTLANA